MSTQTLAPASLRQRTATDRTFYLVMALASTLLLFIGFSRTYYLRSAHFVGLPLSPLIHVHAIVFSLWMIYFCVQTALIAVKKPALHRRLGIAGAFLGSAMVVLGLAVAFSAVRLHHSNVAQDPETIFLVALGDITTFALFFGLGFLLRRNREAHQRLMLLAVVVGLTGPAIGRLPAIGAPVSLLPLLFFAFLLAGPLYDLFTRRRIHPVYLYGCAFAILTMTPIRFALGATPWWHHMAHVIAHY